jgi:hypothetical protein
MVYIFGQYCIVTGWSAKTGFTRGDSCPADQSFAFVKVSLLLAYAHDDPWLSRSAFVVPPACGSGARIEARSRPVRLWVLFATANNQRCEQRPCNSQYSASIHEAADTIQRKSTHSTVKSVLMGQVVASQKRPVSAGITQFDALRPQKYAHDYDHSAIAD